MADPLASGPSAPVAGSTRDRAIDVLRGFFIIVMVAGHVSGDTLIHEGLTVTRWLTGAEGFVAFSGFVLGIVHRRRIATLGIQAANRRIWGRAVRVYLVQFALVLSAALILIVTGGPSFIPTVEELGGWPATLGLMATLRYQPRYLDILTMYVVFLAVAPLALAAFRRGWTGAIVAGSVAIWAWAQLVPGAVQLSHPVFGDDAFRLGAWQIVFIGGLAAGWHRDAVAATAARLGPALPVAAGLVFATCFALAQLDRDHVDIIDIPIALVSKPDLAPLRLLYFLAFVGVALPITRRLVAIDRLRLVTDALGGVGRRSLASFITLTALTILFWLLGGPGWPGWAQELATAGAILFVIWAAPRPFLERLIPN